MDQQESHTPPPTEAPTPARKRGKPTGRNRIDPELIHKVLVETNGNVRTAADVIGCSTTTIQYHIDHDPRLQALFLPPDKVAAAQVGEVESMTRGRAGTTPAFAPAQLVGDQAMAEVVQIQDEELMIQGLKKVGISDEMLEKLRNISALGPSAGRFMASSLALTHKLMVVQTIELKQEADYIREHYLRDENLSAEERSYWQKCYNEIADLIGKGFDRTLAGTQALIAMQRGGAGKGRPAKPGPQPLNTKPVLPA